jgi:hypothetical protein
MRDGKLDVDTFDAALEIVENSLDLHNELAISSCTSRIGTRALSE